jgi:hypothetical protein
MNFFQFEAFPLSAGKSRFQATNLLIFGLVGKYNMGIIDQEFHVDGENILESQFLSSGLHWSTAMIQP